MQAKHLAGTADVSIWQCICFESCTRLQTLLSRRYTSARRCLQVTVRHVGSCAHQRSVLSPGLQEV